MGNPENITVLSKPRAINVLVVDMIEGFTRKGIYASPVVEALIEPQKRFLEQLPNLSYVVFACDAHDPRDDEMKVCPCHCLKASEEAAICPELRDAVRARNIQHDVIQKATWSAFYNNPEMEKAANRHYIAGGRDNTKWVVIGCVTDICVLANVLELLYRGKEVILLRDLITTYQITPEFAAKVLGDPEKAHDPEVVNRFFLDWYYPKVLGVTVTTSEAFLQNLNG